MRTLFNATVQKDFDAAVEHAVVAQALVRSAARLFAQHDERIAIRQVCEALTQATSHVRLAWTWFGPADTPRIKPQVVVGADADYARALSIERNPLTQQGPAFRALSGKRAVPFKVSAFSVYGPWRDAARETAIRSALALPMGSGGDGDRGLLVLYADRTAYFELVGLGLFEALADLFGTVLSDAVGQAGPRFTAPSDGHGSHG